MAELHFTPRTSPAWPEASVVCSDDGARTIGATALADMLEVSSDIAGAARKAQLDIFQEFRKGHSTLCDNDVADARPLRYLDREEQLQPLLFWLRDQYRLDDEYDLDAVWLMAHEVGFHTDPVHAHSGPFLIWQVAGPAKVVEFPQVGQAYPMQVGSTLLFDGDAPHGLRLPKYSGLPFDHPAVVSCPPATADDITVYVSVELPWTEHLEELLGILRLAGEGAEYAVDSCTGAMTLCAA